ncbi:transposase [Gluconobacter kondonii]|uniref:IS66 family insertion sequence element accessory protein TnpA n=3 Tax=Gluconobacter kondonii TaxID=941463 RepID=UPI001FD480F1|nr:transposase [Gluconobacter kondonii]MCP1237156.1 transposase [Gluconobacter kondonii]
MAGFGQDYWQQHYDAWQMSGLTRAAYCREHGLVPRSFRRWVVRMTQQIDEQDSLAEKRSAPVVREKGHWRDVSSLSLEGDRPVVMAQLLSDRQFRRRKWTQAERQDVVWDLLQSGMSTWKYAKAHNLAPSMLYRWLKDLAEPIPGPHQPAPLTDPPPLFATVQLTSDATASLPTATTPPPLRDVNATAPVSSGQDMQIGLPNGAFLRVPVQIELASLRAILNVLATPR